MRADIQPGSVFPDYELPDHTGVKRKLSVLQGHDPLVLLLLRGHFCPKDRQQLHQLVAFHPQVVVGVTQIVTITTDNLMQLNELRQGVGAQWPFLSDEHGRIRDELGIEEFTDPQHRPMIPHTLVLEPGLKIFKVYNGYWYWGRPSTAELHQDLRDVTRRIRPDYRIDTPEMRAKWEAGEKDSFYPYDSSTK